MIDTDGYGRTVGLVYFGKDYRRDASFEVISAGWAWAYWQYLHKLPYGYKKRYAAAHYSAKNAKSAFGETPRRWSRGTTGDRIRAS